MTSQTAVQYLCVNAGSSSLKLAVYQIRAGEEACRLREASAVEIGHPESRIAIDGESQAQPLAHHHTAFEVLMASWNPGPVKAVGHRIVHGGDHTQPEIITKALLMRLQALTPLAPLHNPPALAGIHAASCHFPGITQVACFDTAFHATLPEVARTLPLPRRYLELGVRRYGFHGLSYEYVLRKLGHHNRGRLVIAHLGNGASLSAIQNGQCIDTTMGLTPSGGVMMGTRCGDIDPGVLLYLERTEQLDQNRLEHLLNNESGLLGVSGVSADMARLLQDDSPPSRLAVTLFAYQIRKSIGALTAALGGLDRLVFTGGIGEHAAAIRWMICRGLEYQGIRLSAAANDAHEELISSADSDCPVQVIATDEDAMIAHHVFNTLRKNDAS